MMVATKLVEAMDIVLVSMKQGANGRVTEEGQGQPHMNKRSWCHLLEKSNESHNASWRNQWFLTNTVGMDTVDNMDDKEKQARVNDHSRMRK